LGILSIVFTSTTMRRVKKDRKRKKQAEGDEIIRWNAGRSKENEKH
jgi:hypothetical protein